VAIQFLLGIVALIAGLAAAEWIVVLIAAPKRRAVERPGSAPLTTLTHGARQENCSTAPSKGSAAPSIKGDAMPNKASPEHIRVLTDELQAKGIINLERPASELLNLGALQGIPGLNIKDPGVTLGWYVIGGGSYVLVCE
jgi:hypothetical protein